MVTAQLLDLRTIVLVTGTLACFMSLVLQALRRSYPNHTEGLKLWALAPLLSFAAALLFGLRGMVPEALSIGVANVLLLQVPFLYLSGSCSFLGRPLHRAAFVAQALVSALTLAWLLGTHPSYAQRVVFMSTLLAGLCSWHAYVIWHHARRSFATHLFLGVLGLLVLVFLLRGVTAALLPLIEGLYAPSPIQSLYLLSHGFGVLLLSLGTVLMAAEQRREELQHMAARDSLTGALTRRALFELGEAELARSRQTGRPLSVLMLDLDFFKAINDQHGHRVGDLVIRDFAARAQTLLRRPALLSRYGGEEFVAVLPDTDTLQARLVAERIRESASADASLPRCTVSIGVATTGVADTASLDRLIDQADLGLYQAKAQGRNRVAWVEDRLEPIGAERHNMQRPRPARAELSP